MKKIVVSLGRLNKKRKDEILDCIIMHTFEERVTELQKTFITLCNKVQDTLLKTRVGPDALELEARLMQLNVVETTSDIYIGWRGNHAMLAPYVTNDGAYTLKKDFSSAVALSFGNRRRWRLPHINYLAAFEETLECKPFLAACKRLKEDHTKTTGALTSMINSVSTGKKLRESWPGISEYVNFESEVRALAVSTSELEATLKKATSP